MRLHAELPPESQHCAKFSGHKCYESEDIKFSRNFLLVKWSKAHVALMVGAFYLP